MARLFDDAASEYLQISSGVVGVEPFTLSAWGYTDDITASNTLVSVSEVPIADTHWHAMQLTNSTVRLRSVLAATVEATTATSNNTWHNAIGVFAADNDRRVYLDGGSKNTDTTTVATNANDTATIGVIQRKFSRIHYMSGRIAEVGIWDVALTDAEAAILGAGYSPLFVRPQSLIAYWPLIRDEDQDRIGGFDLTAFNTPSIAEHPPIIYSAPPYYTMPVSAAPAGITGPLIGGRLVKGGPLIKGRLVR